MKSIYSIVAAFALMAVFSTAHAADTWNGSVDNVWTNIANWDDGDGTVTILQGDDGDSITDLTGDGGSILGATKQALNLRGGHTLNILPTGLLNVSGNMNVGRGVTGDGTAVNHSGGTLNIGGLDMGGNATGGTSTYTLSDAAALSVASFDAFDIGGNVGVGDYDTTFEIVGDAATVTIANRPVVLRSSAIMKFTLGATGIDTIDTTGAFTLQSGAELTIDGSSYTGGAGTITLFSYASRADATQFTEDISGFTDLDAAVVYTDTKIDLVLVVPGSNVPPVADSQSITMFPNASTNITLTGSDPDSGPGTLTYSVDVTGLVGELTGTAPNLTYTPTNGYQGVDSFTFTVNDGEDDSAPATVAITVTNQVPVVSGKSYVVYANTNTAITLTASDPDNGPSNLTYSVTDPTNGTLTGTAPDLIYEPYTDYIGADSFTFTVNDGMNDSDAATVEITVKTMPDGVNATVVIDDDINGWTQQDAGAGNKANKDNLPADDGVALWGVSNQLDKQGMLYNTYSNIVDGSSLPSTIQAGTYTLELRIGNGNFYDFTGLNDISSGGNTVIGAVAGFFSTVGSDAQASKNNMYTEFNGVDGVTYTAPTEADPADLTWTTWTFTWEIAEGSPVIGSDPNFGVYNRTSGPGSAFFDNSILWFAEANPITSVDDFGIELVDGKVALSWMTVSGASYGVEATDNLTIDDWDSITNGLPGIDDVLSITLDVTEDQLFYRAYLDD